MTDAKRLLREDPPGEDKRRQILVGANHVFLANGYEGASMSDIALEAGVSKGTLYVYFTNKEALFSAAVQQYSREHAAHVFDSLSPEAPLEAALRNCGLRYIELLLAPEVQAIYRVVIAESPKFPELGRAFFEAGPGRSLTRLSQFLRDRAASGELQLDNPALAADQFFDLCKSTIILRCQMQVIETPKLEQIAPIVDEAVRIFLKAYRPETTP